ncbi:MAG TPA: hypothetical protein VNL37_02160, partial [Candidatus Polarisedimenticolia bacterium]|nr:hypothetical protein [Candidatus Polarisedimenticolia bacterium]
MLPAAVAAPVPAWWMTLSLALTCLLLVLLLLPGRRLLQHRSVLAHVPLARAWESVGDLPALLGRHGRVEEARRIESWSLRRGAGRTSGT